MNEVMLAPPQYYSCVHADFPKAQKWLVDLKGGGNSAADSWQDGAFPAGSNAMFPVRSHQIIINSKLPNSQTRLALLGLFLVLNCT